MRCVGEKKLGEEEVEKGDQCAWFDEWFKSMNEMDESCKCKSMCVWP